MNYVVTIIGFIVGGGLFGFIEFLLRRSDAKKDRFSDVVKEISLLRNEVKEEITSISKDIEDLRSQIDSNNEERKKNEAISCRVRILRFADDLQDGRKCSKDSYDQCLSDVDTYEKFCCKNPDFKNNQTASTIEYIERVYKERLEKHDFIAR